MRVPFERGVRQVEFCRNRQSSSRPSVETCGSCIGSPTTTTRRRDGTGAGSTEATSHWLASSTTRRSKGPGETAGRVRPDRLVVVHSGTWESSVGKLARSARSNFSVRPREPIAAAVVLHARPDLRQSFPLFRLDRRPAGVGRPAQCSHGLTVQLPMQVVDAGVEAGEAGRPFERSPVASHPGGGVDRVGDPEPSSQASGQHIVRPPRGGREVRRELGVECCSEGVEPIEPPAGHPRCPTDLNAVS